MNLPMAAAVVLWVQMSGSLSARDRESSVMKPGAAMVVPQSRLVVAASGEVQAREADLHDVVGGVLVLLPAETSLC